MAQGHTELRGHHNWQATERETARTRWQALQEQWQAEEPEVVAVIERVWDQTSLVLYRTLATGAYTFVGEQFGVQ